MKNKSTIESKEVMNTIIHGENALIPIPKAPKGIFKKFTSFIVGHSETGHHHILEAVKGQEFDIMVSGDDIYITSAFESSLVHKKTQDIHETVIVQPGTYKVTRKNEYDPFSQIIRQVWD